MLHAQQPIYRMCTDGSIPIYPKHEFIKLFPLGYLSLLGLTLMVLADTTLTARHRLWKYSCASGRKMIQCCWCCFCFSALFPPSFPTWSSASIRAYVMWVFCVEIFLPLRCTVFRYLSSTYLDDDDDDAPTEKTAAKICHVDLFLLNCGCWVYTRVNSFMVWISRIEGLINGVLWGLN